MLRVLSWNIAHCTDGWRALTECDADVALLQEACEPPSDIASRFDLDTDPWRTVGLCKRPWRTAIVGLNPNIRIDRFVTRPLCESTQAELGVTRPGTISAARVEDPDTKEVFTLVSMYALWEKSHTTASSSLIYADASAHRLISDICMLVGRENGHQVIAAGDLNILHGHGEHGNRYWASRYQSIFDRFTAIGMKFVGPQFPNGLQAVPWPKELPTDSFNIPTYRTNRYAPETATRQLDFVFASTDISNKVQTRALNSIVEWGGSDHCKILIDVT